MGLEGQYSDNAFYGTGSPEGVVTAKIGAVFHRKDGGYGTSFYAKESGTGNTGWTQMLTASGIKINFQTGTTYTFLSTDKGWLIDALNASGQTYTLPNNLPAEFMCSVLQAGTGQVTFSPAGGASLRSPSGQNKTASQWAVANLHVRTNTSGTNAEWVISGNIAA